MGNLIRVLVVDDEPGILTTVAANLELAELDVVTASSGQEAIELSMKRGPFDLVLTDLRMPGFSGAELLRRLRGLQPGIPVILMTAYAQENLMGEVFSDGVFTVVNKPFEVDDVVRIVLRAAKRPFVLVVDSVRTSGSAMAAALQGVGLGARAVQSAGEALLVLGMNNVDVCIVDASLTGQDGEALTKKIREKNAAVRVIAVAEPGATDVFSKSAAGGAFGCVEKPIDTAKLVRLIARARGTNAA